MNRHSRVNVPSDNKEFSYKSKVIRSHLISQSDWKPIEDPVWNSENAKLGLLEGQTYSNLNLDLGQFLTKLDKKEAQDATTLLNDSLVSNNLATGIQRQLPSSASRLSTSMRSVDHETTTHFFNANKKPSNVFVDTFKLSLISNYWEN